MSYTVLSMKILKQCVGAEQMRNLLVICEKKWLRKAGVCIKFFAEILDGAAANEESYQMMKYFFQKAVPVVHKMTGGVL